MSHNNSIFVSNNFSIEYYKVKWNQYFLVKLILLSYKIDFLMDTN